MHKQYISSESVTEGHPDKICDQLSDGLLDAFLSQDPTSRVAVECLITTGLVVIAGEVTTKAQVGIQSIVKKIITDIGYTDSAHGFDPEQCTMIISLHEQSPDIAAGVNLNEGIDQDQGAGDQGIMYGYATNETPEFMPLPISLAHQLTHQLATLRKTGLIDRLRPDGKAQVTVEYQDGEPIRVDTVVISTQHAPHISHAELSKTIIEQVIQPVCGERIDNTTTYHINPTGSFIIGGPHGDAGLTGRKIIIDTYGGIGRHGGGAFSGKDPSKVDRSAAYMARYLAKNIVASGICDLCEIQLGYAIGVSQPVNLYLNCFGTEKVSLEQIITVIKKSFDLSPAGIIQKLQLLDTHYLPTATYGHFGRTIFPWEATDSSDIFARLR